MEPGFGAGVVHYEEMQYVGSIEDKGLGGSVGLRCLPWAYCRMREGSLH